MLYSFTGTGGDGAFPYAGLVRDTEGNLYGTTESGGSSACLQAGRGCGVVFELDKTGKETLLYVFTGEADGGTARLGIFGSCREWQPIWHYRRGRRP